MSDEIVSPVTLADTRGNITTVKVPLSDQFHERQKRLEQMHAPAVSVPCMKPRTGWFWRQWLKFKLWWYEPLRQQ